MNITLEIELKTDLFPVYIEVKIDAHIKEDENGSDYLPDLTSFEIKKASIIGIAEDEVKPVILEIIEGGDQYQLIHDYLQQNYDNEIIKATIEAWGNYDLN